jgi:type IV pilus assembly protein PilB
MDENYLLSTELQQLVTTEQAWHYGVIPKSNTSNAIEFFVDEKTWQTYMADELEMLLGKTVVPNHQPSTLIRKALGRYYLRNTRSAKTETGKVKQLVAKQTDDFLPTLISEAKELGSSDIHIEVYEDRCRVRIRMDGLLVERYTVPRSEYPALINKIKIRANLDIAEKRLPQDGRIFFQQDGMKFDIRVSILPTLHGEKIVMRLLNNDASGIDIRTLGFTPKQESDYLEGIRKPHGILLISGPTGSGKTTTLYATLKLLNKETTNIVTVEDPIEYTLEGINQVQLKESIGLGFASALRTFLRQDPDVIMLGEIRDGETAQMAIRAALTGHLVLSTIHTNSAWGTISRLMDMGIPSFLIASTINTSVAQRLVRLLCPHCKQEQEFHPRLLPPRFKPISEIKTHCIPTGCSECYFTGYRGRKAVYEVIPIDYEIAELIKANSSQIGSVLREQEITSLADNAFSFLQNGETSLDEVYPILYNSYS